MASQVEDIKWVPGTSFIVDGFAFQSPKCSHYFLTHFHSDHTVGLSRGFKGGLIYCSHVTARLLVHDKGLRPEVVRPLALGVPVVIEGVRVTPLDANHCPGAVMFLFEVPCAPTPLPSTAPLEAAARRKITAAAATVAPQAPCKVSATQAPARPLWHQQQQQSPPPGGAQPAAVNDWCSSQAGAAAAEAGAAGEEEESGEDGGDDDGDGVEARSPVRDDARRRGCCCYGSAPDGGAGCAGVRGRRAAEAAACGLCAPAQRASSDGDDGGGGGGGGGNGAWPGAGAATHNVLHTGDCRWQPWMRHQAGLAGVRVDTLFLDTTYAAPRHNHPPQEEAVALMVQAMREALAEEPRTLFLVAAYHIGKERAFLGAAQQLGARVWVSSAKRAVLRHLDLPPGLMGLLVDDPRDAALHVTGWGMRPEELRAYLDRHPGVWKRAVGIRPTGWTFRRRGGLSVWRDGNATIVGVPYSEHSSWAELCDAVSQLRPRRLVPTVNAASPAQRRALVDRFAHLMDLRGDRSRMDVYLLRGTAAGTAYQRPGTPGLPPAPAPALGPPRATAALAGTAAPDRDRAKDKGQCRSGGGDSPEVVDLSGPDDCDPRAEMAAALGAEVAVAVEVELEAQLEAEVGLDLKVKAAAGKALDVTVAVDVNVEESAALGSEDLAAPGGKAAAEVNMEAMVDLEVDLEVELGLGIKAGPEARGHQECRADASARGSRAGRRRRPGTAAAAQRKRLPPLPPAPGGDTGEADAGGRAVKRARHAAVDAAAVAAAAAARVRSAGDGGCGCGQSGICIVDLTADADDDDNDDFESRCRQQQRASSGGADGLPASSAGARPEPAAATGGGPLATPPTGSAANSPGLHTQQRVPLRAGCGRERQSSIRRFLAPTPGRLAAAALMAEAR